MVGFQKQLTELMGFDAGDWDLLEDEELDDDKYDDEAELDLADEEDLI